MTNKVQTFNSYSEKFKHNAVMRYVNGSKSYKVLAEKHGKYTLIQLLEFNKADFPYAKLRTNRL
jgi:transposase-like protein